MKIKNLYVGDICLIQDVEVNYSGDGLFLTKHTTCTSVIQRTTVLYRRFDKSNHMIDIIYGGKYPTKPNGKIGNLYIEKPESLLSRIDLKEDEFLPKNINKRKVLKLIEKLEEENKINEE